MRQLVVGALLALMVAGASPMLVMPVHASTVHGSAVTISGLDDLAATADQQARRGAGKIIAMVWGWAASRPCSRAVLAWGWPVWARAWAWGLCPR